MEKIIISTLTTGTRDETLIKCLASIQELTDIPGFKVDILVVENNLQPNQQVKAIIDMFSGGIKNIKLLQEPRKGIPFARNAALNFAKDNCYTYLAFIDDDAFASINWLKVLVESIQNANVATGPQLAIFPEGTHKFFKQATVYHERNILDGALITWSATNNVLVDVNFVKQHDLSFNTALIHGGEDKELFLRVHKLGGKLVWCKNAVVNEYIADNRLSIAWAMRRTFRIGATGFMIESAIRSPLQTYLTCIFKGTVYLSKGVLFAPYHALSSKSSLLNSLCDLSHGVGFFYGLFTKGRVSQYT